MRKRGNDIRTPFCSSSSLLNSLPTFPSPRPRNEQNQNPKKRIKGGELCDRVFKSPKIPHQNGDQQGDQDGSSSHRLDHGLLLLLLLLWFGGGGREGRVVSVPFLLSFEQKRCKTKFWDFNKR